MIESVKLCKEHGIKTTAAQKKAMAFLESRGRRWLVDFGYENAESTARTQYDFRAGPLDIKTLNGMVLRYLRIRKAGWWTPAELVLKVNTETDRTVSDSSITARLRDLRQPRYGAHRIDKRLRAESTAYEYRLVAE